MDIESFDQNPEMTDAIIDMVDMNPEVPDMIIDIPPNDLCQDNHEMIMVGV